jgi:DNA invertase Pin-like site-specific DNA recombinase
MPSEASRPDYLSSIILSKKRKRLKPKSVIKKHTFAIPHYHIKMTFEEYEKRINSLREIVLAERTGSPKELARQFKISERTVRRMIQHLNQPGFEVEFCRKQNSYIFKKIK